MWWILGVVAVAAVLSAYLGWTARRVERVHVRAASAARALDQHLLRRAAAAAVVAEHRGEGGSIPGREQCPGPAAVQHPAERVEITRRDRCAGRHRLGEDHPEGFTARVGRHVHIHAA